MGLWDKAPNDTLVKADEHVAFPEDEKYVANYKYTPDDVFENKYVFVITNSAGSEVLSGIGYGNSRAKGLQSARDRAQIMFDIYISDLKTPKSVTEEIKSRNQS